MRTGEIPPALRVAIICGTRRTCVACGLRGLCQIDHIRPVHAGGQTIPVNLAALCPQCNMVKSCYWPGHGYQPFPHFDDIDHADAILDAEIAWIRERHPEREIWDNLWAHYGVRDPNSHYAAAENAG